MYFIVRNCICTQAFGEQFKWKELPGKESNRVKTRNDARRQPGGSWISIYYEFHLNKPEFSSHICVRAIRQCVVWCRYGGWRGTVTWDELIHRCSDSQTSWMFSDQYLLPLRIHSVTVNISTTDCPEGGLSGGLHPTACHGCRPNPPVCAVCFGNKSTSSPAWHASTATDLRVSCIQPAPFPVLTNTWKSYILLTRWYLNTVTFYLTTFF